MALLTKQGGEGAAITYAAATSGAGGDTYRNTGKERFHVRNASGGPIVATVHRPQTCNFGFTHDTAKAITVPAGQDRVLGPYDRTFNDASGNVKVTYDAVTSVTVAVI